MQYEVRKNHLRRLYSLLNTDFLGCSYCNTGRSREWGTKLCGS